MLQIGDQKFINYGLLCENEIYAMHLKLIEFVSYSVNIAKLSKVLLTKSNDK